MEHKNSGLAAIITDECGGEKNMYVGTKFVGGVFVDITKNFEEEIKINSEGIGKFKVKDGSCSIWIKK